MPHPVRLVPYDPAWPAAFEREKRAVAAALADLGDAVVAIEHVGSTAVPGLEAKPVIDVDVGVRVRQRTRAGRSDGFVPVTRVLAGDAYAERLEPLGFTWKRGAFEGRERELFQRRAGAEGVHVHLMRHGSREWTREIAFRDALRADAALRDAYVAVKRAAAAKHPGNGELYAVEKGPFIEAVVGPPPA